MMDPHECAPICFTDMLCDQCKADLRRAQSAREAAEVSVVQLSTALLVYLELERLAFRFDNSSKDNAADLVRDLMDNVWMLLSDEEKALLNDRGDDLEHFSRST